MTLKWKGLTNTAQQHSYQHRATMVCDFHGSGIQSTEQAGRLVPTPLGLGLRVERQRLAAGMIYSSGPHPS